MCEIGRSPPSSGDRTSKKGGLTKSDSIQCLKHVLECDSENVKLTRYKYNKLYTIPTLETCKNVFPNVCCETAAFNEVSIYFLATSANELEAYTKYMPGVKLKKCRVDSVADDVGWDGTSHPVVLVLPTHHKKTLLHNLSWLTKAEIVLFSNSDQACRPSSKGEYRMPRQLITAETNQETFVKDLDCALERYLFSFLKTFAEIQNEEVSQNREKLSIIRDLQTEINALFKRSDIPRSEFPKTSKTTEISVSDEEKRKLFTKLTDVPSVVGFGFRYHVLHINIDKTAPDREQVKNVLDVLINQSKISHYKYSFLSKSLVQFRRCGERIYSIPNTSVTLGCFASSKCHLYALTCKHITRETKTCAVYINDDDRLLGYIQAFSVEKDIAAIQVEPDLANTCEKALRDEDSRPFAVACPIWDRETFQLPLSVYIIGAQTCPGIGKVVSLEYHFGGFTHFILIENKTTIDFCKPGDSGAIVMARPNHKTVFAIAMILGEIPDVKPKQYLAIRLQDSLPELEKILQSRIELLTHS